jgi:uncharacterized membrane protein
VKNLVNQANLRYDAHIYEFLFINSIQFLCSLMVYPVLSDLMMMNKYKIHPDSQLTKKITYRVYVHKFRSAHFETTYTINVRF